MYRSLWKFFTSLRLTVVCLAFGILLVFFGTLAQVHEGLYQAQDRWFRSFFIWWHPTPLDWGLPHGYDAQIWGKLLIPIHYALHWGGEIVERFGRGFARIFGPNASMPVFPGGYLIGFTLLANLVAAHIKRFQWTSKKVGIHLTHFGIVLLLVGQLMTDMLSKESTMSFREGETKNYSEAQRDNELAIATDAGSGQEEVVSIDERLLAKGGEITHPRLPFTMRVKEYHANGEVLSHKQALEAWTKLSSAVGMVEGEYASNDGLVTQAERAQETAGRTQVWRDALKAIGQPDTNDIVGAAKAIAANPEQADRLRTELKTRFQKEMLSRFSQQGGAMRFAAERVKSKEPLAEGSLPAAAPNGDGQQAIAIPQPETHSMDSRNIPYALLEIVGKSGQPLGTWLVSPFLDNQEFKADGKPYRAALRFTRTYYPFSLTLLRATHEVYQGTDIPKNFQSRVRVSNAQTGENREVDIYMNNPLRYSGLTFYQYQMGPAEAASRAGSSTLQVVRNPGWLTPYFGCIVVALGMTWQFLYHLVGFITKGRASAPASKAQTTKGAAARQTAEAGAR